MAYVATMPMSYAGLARPIGLARPGMQRRFIVPAPRYRGLGAAATPAQLVGAFGGAASGVVTSLAAPAVAHALGLTLGVAVPIVGAAFAGILIGVELLMNSGCGQTCVVTSQWANEAEPLLVQNVQKYFSLNPRTTEDQASALNVFDAIWAGLMQRCSQPGLGEAGRNCIADRQAGACKWRADKPARWPGGVAQGSCFNWFADYRDPIANDTGVVSVGNALVSALMPGAGKSLLLPAAVIAGLVLLGLVL